MLCKGDGYIVFVLNFRIKEDETGNITMKETGSKPLKPDDLDTDVSLHGDWVNSYQDFHKLHLIWK